MNNAVVGPAIRELSDRLVVAQRPIKVLNAIKWDDQVRQAFFSSGFKEQPPVDRDYYAARAIRLDPSATIDELRGIEADATSRLGRVSPAATLIRFMSEQFRLTVEMIEARGTERFSPLSTLLYGSPSDVFHAGGPTVADLASTLRQSLDANAVAISTMKDDRTIPGPQAADLIREQLDASVGKGRIEVMPDDGIVADAAAGSDYIKVRQDRFFSQRDVDLLVVHEGWVHCSTTLNGLAQPYCTFLGKAAPRTTVTQEGLAVLTEILNLKSHPRRVDKLMRRIEAIDMAAQGASFVEVFEACRLWGMNEDDCWATTSRVFRGSLPEAGPFTKDLGYGKGLVYTLLYVRMAIRFGKTDRIPLLFCGKVDLLDMAPLYQLWEEGLIDISGFIPPPFDDMASLGSTLAFSRFTADLDLERVSADFEKLF
jgi:uncharacterized protein (TIGR02421 family)